MTPPAYASFAQWSREGRQASYVRARKSPGAVLDLLDFVVPAGEISRPAMPDIVLFQDMLGGSRNRGDLGRGPIDVISRKGNFYLGAPGFAPWAVWEESHQLQSLAFSKAQWHAVLDEASDGSFSFDSSCVYGQMFDSPALRSAFRTLWSLYDDEGAPSRLLARAAGCEILAELCRLGGTPFTPAKGGLAPWAERRCLELLRARLSDDISLDELAAEAQLSAFHFARMFKQSLGVPPRVYLMRLRVEKACELLETTDLPITEIALEVGYSSNQALARVFTKHRSMNPSDYRRAVRDPLRAVA
ncbi:helix-turn-helix domain-containing protein [Tabrizicola sp.]|uniref:helix-turn-helix domain-containing protein n=1 Tax=Tabrizicola sp. TaxID=2005166 RepID=UPI003F36F6FA